MSTPPKARATRSVAPFTASSLVTSMATPMALPPEVSMPAATFWAASRFTSAMATATPRLASSSAMPLPIPLAAPVTIADFPFRSMVRSFASSEIVKHDLPQSQGQVGHEMLGAQHFKHRQFRHRCQRMRRQRQCRRTFPGTLHRHILQVIAHQLADARGAVDMRNDLQKIVGRDAQALPQRLSIERTVLVSHGSSGNPDRTVVERAHQRVDLGVQLGLGQLLGETP